MNGSTLAKRYALSLVQLGAEQNRLDDVRRELTRIEALFTSTPELSASFADPALGHDRKKELMGQVVDSCACSELVGNFLRLLVDKKRVTVLPQIIQAFERLADEHSGLLRPTITTAFELDGGQLEAIRGALERQSSRSVIPRVAIDATLLGGVVVRIGDTVYDSSVRTQLRRIQDQLQKG